MLPGMNGDRQEPGKGQTALKKAYEISYAVFRIASRIGNVAFKEHLERQALSLLDAAAVENYAWVRIVSRAIEYLVRFGSDVGFIHESNKDLILAELQGMELGIVSPEVPTSVEPVPLNDIFSGQETLFRHVSKFRKNNHAKIAANEVHDHAAVEQHQEIAASGAETELSGVVSSGAGSGSMLGPEIRQSAILQKLKESGTCRMRDLQEILPNYSERTLRYDLQTLTEQNLVERIGSGGPAVYYRMRQV